MKPSWHRPDRRVLTRTVRTHARGTTNSPSPRRFVLSAVFVVATANAFLAATTAWAQAAEPSGPAIEFNRDIRPILSDKCYACHGPDKNTREADLRLDTQEGLFQKRDDGANVLPGEPLKSHVWRRMVTDEVDARMPPIDSGKELSPAERELVRRWIEQGAPWEGHWSFQPIKRVVPPVVRDVDSNQPPVRNPIDALVRRELQAAGLQASPEADRVTLIRRLSFDLRGLPPSPAEVARFVDDRDENAYEKLVDRFLESPEYGERMAQWWLDVVRYADSVGYHGDQPVSVYPYREYVIRAFQENMRFDTFTIEQLAGDLLPNPSLSARVASGYNRLGMMSAEGGVQDKEYLAKYIAERVRNVGAAWLGVTLGCCECHDHKYDPFSMRDFYSLEAFFADIQERGLYSGANSTGEWGPSLRVPNEEQTRKLEELDRQRAALRQVLDTPTAELAAAQAEWEKSQVHWTIPKLLDVRSRNETMLKVLPDGSVLASGPNPATNVHTLEMGELPARITAVRLEALPDASLPRQGPGRASNGNFVLSEIVARLIEPDGKSREIALNNASATYEQTGAAGNNPYGKWSAASAIDGDVKGEGWGWAIMEQVGKAQAIVVESTEELVVPAGARLVVELKQLHENPTHTLGRFRVSVTSHARPVRAEHGGSPEIAAILAIPATERADGQREKLAAHYRTISPLLDAPRKRLAELDAAHAAFEKQIPKTLVTVAVSPRTVRVLPRGNWMDESGEVVLPALPGVLPQPMPRTDRLTRLDLARWLVAPENPLTARNVVNRVWKLFFGAGLSRKLDDLGAQGEWPTHPVLLDWLAGEFIDSGWNVKQLVKTVVMSHVYRQSSLETPRLREADPFNRLLARQSRWRLDAEFLRDNALAASGLLVRKVGGPSVFPYQPPGYWAYLNFPQREWRNSEGDDLYRRGLYTHWQRQYLHPSLLAFDAPSREECAADRPRSNTPLQSLVLLNDTSYVEAARVLAEGALREGGSSVAARVAWIFQRALSRSPSDAELQVLTPLLERHLAEYRLDGKSVDDLLSVGARPVPPGIDRVELAAWTSVTRVVFNLHEFVTRN